ncbi:MAG: hypothetical protein FWD90_02300 [Defluviitaleaceae bacterium]|nr:hypothetical protein [Defluviitaleaceae bacterium]
MKRKCLIGLLIIGILSAVFIMDVAGNPIWPPAQGRRIHTGSVMSLDIPANIPAGGSDAYRLRFEWNQPDGLIPEDTRWHQVPGTGGPMPPELNDTHGSAWTRSASQYLFTFTNRTQAGTVGQVSLERGNPGFVDTNGQPFLSNQEINPGLRLAWETTRQFQHSSLYEITIDPSHRVPIWTPPNPPIYPTGHLGSTALSIMEPDGPLAPNSIPIVFMSDIEVRAEGHVNEIIVEWHNPLWEGANVFPSWEITIIDSVTNAVLGGPRLVLFSETDPLDGGRRLRYALTDSRLQIGRSYHVRVEPMIAPGRPARGESRLFNIIPGRPEVFFAARRMGTASAPMFTYQTRIPVLMVPELELLRVGADHVRLHWPSIPAGVVSRIEIEQWRHPVPPDPPPPALTRDVLVILPGQQAQSITEWDIGQIIPLEPRAFSIALFDPAGQMLARSNLVYFIPDIADFIPYTPNIEQITPHIAAGGAASLSLYWRAFSRSAYSDEERRWLNEAPHNLYDWPGEAQIIDMDLHYRIFVSDSWENLAWENPRTPFIAPVIDRFDPLGRLMPDLINSPGRNHTPILQFPGGITQYMAQNENGMWELRNLSPNSVYFIRIEAVRDHPSGEPTRAYISRPSFGVIYIPPVGDLLLNPEMIDAPPLRGVASNIPNAPPEITLDWDLRFVEIGNQTSAPDWDRWHASAGVRNPNTNPSLAFGRTADLLPGVENWATLNRMIRENSTPLWNQLVDRTPSGQNFFRNPTNHANFTADVWPLILSFLDLPASFPPHPLRVQDMFNNHYRIHVARHSEVLTRGDTLAEAFEEYSRELLAPDNESIWTSIGRPTPRADGTSTFTITAAQGAALVPNTAYVVFFQPYTSPEAGQTLLSFAPTYVIVTIPDEFIPSIPSPTTPVLFPGQPATDSSVSVRWRLLGDEDADPRTQIRYELRWSESILAHPDNTGFVHLTWEQMQALWHSTENPDGQQRFITHQGSRFHHLTIEDLFPDTAHFLWIRAFNSQDVYSGWSNPIEIHTRDITAPFPPGLGLVSRAHLDAFNLAGNTQYAPIEPNAVNFLLTRTISDYRTHTLPRAGGGTAVGGSAQLLNLTNLRERDYAVRFEGLIHNRGYYARARTIMTVTRGAARTYTYEIQLADNSDFLDAITFTIPSLVPFNPQTMRRAESDWVYMELSTSPSADDFDGAFRPEQFPLPDYDWEITYVNGVLQWRFRTNRTGADGRPDQQADQRFISRLIDSRVHRYSVDLSDYPIRPDWPVSNRELIIPWTILRAFDERRITLDIDFGDTVVSVPPGAFNTAAVQALNMGAGSEIRITMQTLTDASGLPALPPNNRFASLPQRLSVTAVTPQRTLTLSEFARAVEVTAPSEHMTGPDGIIRMGLFFTSPQTGNWQDAAGMRMATLRSGTFAAVSREVPQTNLPNDPSLPAMQRVTARLTFTDMHEYNPRMAVSSAAFNNIMHTLANNRSSVTMGAHLPAADRQSLERARMLAPAALTYEQATDILVRFYELRTRRAIEPMTTPQMVIGIDRTSPVFSQNLLKAADIGFITGTINPGGAFTFGDLMVMLDIIITDTGF